MDGLVLVSVEATATIGLQDEMHPWSISRHAVSVAASQLRTYVCTLWNVPTSSYLEVNGGSASLRLY